MGNESKAQEAINKVSELHPELWDNLRLRAHMRQWNLPDDIIESWLEGFRKAGLGIPDKPAAAD